MFSKYVITDSKIMISIIIDITKTMDVKCWAKFLAWCCSLSLSLVFLSLNFSHRSLLYHTDFQTFSLFGLAVVQSKVSQNLSHLGIHLKKKNRKKGPLSFPGDSELVKNSSLQFGRLRFNPLAGKIPWRRAWPTVVVLPGESHRQRRLVGYKRVGHDWVTKHSKDPS